MKFKFLKNNKKSHNSKEKSRGRSMVEMLGVLAIIGVLSIGGIQGYTIAMRRYKANELINLVNKYAMTTYAFLQQKMLYYDNSEGFGIDPDPFDNNRPVYYCWASPDSCARAVPSFENSGLGKVPEGVEIFLAKIRSGMITNFSDGTDVDNEYRTGIDYVGINLIFNKDKEFAETVYNAFIGQDAFIQYHSDMDDAIPITSDMNDIIIPNRNDNRIFDYYSFIVWIPVN